MTSIFWREQDDDQLVPICVLHTCSAPGHSVGSCCEVVLQRKAVQEEGRDEGSVAAIAPTTSPVLLLHPNCTAVLAYRWTLADLELAQCEYVSWARQAMHASSSFHSAMKHLTSP